MGRICSATSKVDANLDMTFVKTILEVGYKIGFKYHASGFLEKFLSIDEAVNIIIQELNSENDTRYMKQYGSVNFTFQENFPSICFYCYQANVTNVELLTVSHPWCQDKSDTSKRCTPDWDLYITLLLELCKDFAILEISTDDEYFNDYSC
jgi:hypothetical protein